MLRKNKDGYYLIDSLEKLAEWQKIISEESEITGGRVKGTKPKKKSQIQRDRKYKKDNNYENKV